MKITALIFLIPLSVFAQQFNCVMPANVVGWWPGDGNALDVGDGGNNGVLHGGASFTNGLVGQAFNFDGVNGHVRIADRPDLRPTNAITLEAWVNPVQNTGPYHAIMVKWDALVGPDQRAYGLSISPEGWANFGVDANGTAGGALGVYSTNLVVPLNQWTHVAGTYDGSALRIYVNGVLQGVIPYTAGIFPGTADLAIGGVVGGAAPGQVISPFAGLIDEPAIYRRALAASEIEAIYIAGSVGKCKLPFIGVAPQSQVGYWGKSITFTVKAFGAGPLGYLWYKDGFAIPWATNSSLPLTNLLPSDAGNYWVVVTNSLGSATSPEATLLVNPAGVSIGLYPGIRVEGVAGKTYGIQYTTNLNSPTWNNLANLTLTQPSQLWFDADADVTSSNQPRRFYRVIAVP